MAGFSRGLTAMLFCLIITVLVLGSNPSAAGKVAVPFGTQLSFHAFADLTIGANSTRHGKYVKRALSWQQALDKGQEMLDKLNGQRAPGRWSTMDELKNNGWMVAERTPDTETSYYNNPGGPYETLEIEQSNGYEVQAMQLKKFDNCFAKGVSPTGAFYFNFFNVPGKAIVGTFNFAPTYQLLQKDEYKNFRYEDLAPYVPEIRQWSDVVWIEWADQAQQAGVPADSLIYLFKHSCVTKDTQRIMERAANAAEEQFDLEYPGFRLARGTDRFRALLGTPHGKAAAWLVINHLPGKNIETINIFTTEGRYDMLFTFTR